MRRYQLAVARRGQHRRHVAVAEARADRVEPLGDRRMGVERMGNLPGSQFGIRGERRGVGGEPAFNFE
jgi:hypothetical protein